METVLPPAIRDFVRSTPDAATIAGPTLRRDDGGPPRPECRGISSLRYVRAIPIPRHRHTRKNPHRTLRFRPASNAGTWPRIRPAKGPLPRDRIVLGLTHHCRVRDFAHRDKSNGRPCRSGADLHAPEFWKLPSQPPAAGGMRRLNSPASPARLRRRY